MSSPSTLGLSIFIYQTCGIVETPKKDLTKFNNACLIQNCQSRGLIRNILDNQIDIYSFISDGRRLDETRELSIFVLFDRGQVSSDLMLLFGTKY